MTKRVLSKSLCAVLAVAALGCDEELQPDTRFNQDAGQPPPIVSTGGAGGAVAPTGGAGGSCEGANAVSPILQGKAAVASSSPSSLARATVQSATPVPAISGGTMLSTADGSMIVAADPERDQIYFVDAQGMKSLFVRKLNDGDQPGRVVEDAAGRIHVILRGAGAIATLGRDANTEITRRAVCAVPRGIAYDPAGDQLQIACAEGQLVTLAAAPTALMPTRTVDIASDARDVLVRDGQILVSRFRSAELMLLDAAGEQHETRVPPSFAHDEMRKGFVLKRQPDGTCSQQGQAVLAHVAETPDVAWRMIDVPNEGVVMLHQRAHIDEIQVTSGGYGSGSCGGGIVTVAITKGLDKPVPATADMSDMALAVDIAADRDGKVLAVVAPGNQNGSTQVELIQMSQLLPQATGTGMGASVAVVPPGVALPTGGSPSSAPVATQSNSSSGFPCTGGIPLPDPQGQATAVTFVSPSVLAVQLREPAAISFYDLQSNQLLKSVSVDQSSRFDTGHTMFHMRTSSGLACASCHPEAGDDGHVWTFAGIGPRRTQTLRGGILGTEPFHWNGDMKDFGMLMTEVFVGRMSGFTPTSDQTAALSHWVDAEPALHADAADKAAAERGKLLFESSAVGCATCHSGAHLTNNQTENVGTGANLQVPSLKGVRFRTPLMHNGCAASISDRLTKPECGGGDMHGKTSQLSESDVKDLTAYLETL